MVGIGAIFLDWEGKIKATLKMQKNLYPDPFLAKAVAALQASLFCQDSGFRDTILEGDALQVVKGINHIKEIGTSIGMILADARSGLNRFDTWLVVHISRNNNKLAHVLSKDRCS